MNYEKVGEETRRSLGDRGLASRFYGGKSAWHEELSVDIVFRGRRCEGRWSVGGVGGGVGAVGVKVGVETRRSQGVRGPGSGTYGGKSAWHEDLGAVIVFRGRGYVRGTVERRWSWWRARGIRGGGGCEGR